MTHDIAKEIEKDCWGPDPDEISESNAAPGYAGCGNHNCYIRKPSGQATNGQCHCLDPLGKENVLAIKRQLFRMRQALKNISEKEGCECDSYHGHRCLMCEVRSIAVGGLQA
jgi:hypothetical protein